MDWDFWKINHLFSNPQTSRLLLDGKWGLEKESQRVTLTGDLALTDHPAVFGDKLTNPYITTDFAESQLELITPPFRTVEKTYQSLQALQAEAESGIGSELLWPLSMPPRLPAEQDIPLARFNDSQEGREKEIYRRGLALRYGKKMQLISGLHYNFSFGEALLDYLGQQFGSGATLPEKRAFTDHLYFAVARNFLRYRWLLIYLFGASPTFDHTYHSVIRQELKIVAECCPDCCCMIKDQQLQTYLSAATSLRVSRFGYSNPVSGNYHNYFNDLEAYIGNLRGLMATKSREYGNLGVLRNGIQVQLNDNILQKESEFYGAIRFKQIAKPGETQLDLLERQGVKYLEVRILDLNPFEKFGISLRQLHFLQVFMLFCLFEESRPFLESEFAQSNKNHHLVALCGRKADLMIDHYHTGPVLIKNWGREIFDKLRIIARLIDQSTHGEEYQSSIAEEYQKVINLSLLPSDRIEQEMAETHADFLEFGLRRAVLNKQLEVCGYQEVG